MDRYSFVSIGADIALHALSSSQSDTVLAEEVPCTPALCERPGGDFAPNPPLGGQFQRQYFADHTN